MGVTKNKQTINIAIILILLMIFVIPVIWGIYMVLFVACGVGWVLGNTNLGLSVEAMKGKRPI